MFCDLGCQLIRQETRCSRFRTMSGRRSKTSSTSASSFLLHRQSRNPLPASSTMNRCKRHPGRRDRDARRLLLRRRPPSTGCCRSPGRPPCAAGSIGRGPSGPGSSRARRRTGAYRGCGRAGLAAGRRNRRPDTDRNRRARAGRARGRQSSSPAICSSIRANRACVSRSSRAAGESGQRPTIRGADERAAAARGRDNKSAAFRSMYSREVTTALRPGTSPDPVFETDQHHVDALAILRQQAARIEQLLEDLVVRRELDRGGESNSPIQKLQRVLQRLGRERGGDGEAAQSAGPDPKPVQCHADSSLGAWLMDRFQVGNSG